MADGQGRERIAILGGGLGSLTTAFELTATPELRERHDITLYQMGWRLGGKCATGRGPDGRIEEHGIHGFLGSYYNALPLMTRLYEALDRPADHKLAGFGEAFREESFVLMWNVEDGRWIKWPMAMPQNPLDPADPEDLALLSGMMAGPGEFVAGMVRILKRQIEASDRWGLTKAVMEEALEVVGGLAERMVAQEGTDALATLQKLEAVARALLGRIAPQGLQNLGVLVDYMIALLRGMILFDVKRKGYDSLDDMNFAEFLKAAGAEDVTITSPMALNTTNLSYQYPKGDTSRSPDMAAGAYLHWSLRSFAYFGSFAWLFEVGTGETVVQPLYEVLKARGVKFEFFHKVENLALSDDRRSVAAVEMAVQATLKPGASEYDPLTPEPIKGLRCWPARPNYGQLVEGEALAEGRELHGAGGYDLESWWTAWEPVGSRTIRAGEDFDRVVLGISIGALPYICGELLEARPEWRAMCEHVTTVPTQAMQIWLKRTSKELGIGVDMPKDATDAHGYRSDNTPIGATFANPQSGSADFSHLIGWEDWTGETPAAVWYLCGPMDDYDPVPDFSDHDYPKRMDDRVRWQSVQYLQASLGALLPEAVTARQHPPGDAMGLDFELLVCTEDDGARGIARFAQQFHRANIDPTERYVTSPAGSTKHRIKAGETGFDNLVITGDWIYTGLNVGSVEGTVMGGRSAANAISGLPRLEDIPGYLLGAGTG